MKHYFVGGAAILILSACATKPEPVQEVVQEAPVTMQPAPQVVEPAPLPPVIQEAPQVVEVLSRQPRRSP